MTLETSKLDKLIAEMESRIDNFANAVTHGMEADVKQSFGTSPAGRVYGNHVASMPGYPPNVDTGALLNSMHVERRAHAHFRLADGVEYGIYQELIYNRPFMAPVFEDWRQNKYVPFAQQWGLFRV